MARASAVRVACEKLLLQQRRCCGGHGLAETRPCTQSCLPSQPAQRVPEDMLGSGELIEIVSDMYAEMRAAPGVGLAAPQIGLDMQVRAAVPEFLCIS